MSEEFLHNLWLQYGALGLLIAGQAAAIVALWRRLTKREEDYYQQSIQTTAALVELTTFIRDVKR